MWTIKMPPPYLQTEHCKGQDLLKEYSEEQVEWYYLSLLRINANNWNWVIFVYRLPPQIRNVLLNNTEEFTVSFYHYSTSQNFKFQALNEFRKYQSKRHRLPYCIEENLLRKSMSKLFTWKLILCLLTLESLFLKPHVCHLTLASCALPNSFENSW